VSATQREHEHPAARSSRKSSDRRRPPGSEPARAERARTRRLPPPRTALTINEACESLGVGWDLFHESIEPELRVVRIGRRKLIPVSELQAWLDRNAEKMP
jgi:excisionase family DNA binding protein